MPYTTELMTFAVKPGKEERADEWMRTLVQRRAECVASLDREAMHFESIFKSVRNGRMWLSWLSVQGGCGAHVETSVLAVDAVHMDFWREASTARSSHRPSSTSSTSCRRRSRPPSSTVMRRWLRGVSRPSRHPIPRAPAVMSARVGRVRCVDGQEKKQSELQSERHQPAVRPLCIAAGERRSDHVSASETSSREFRTHAARTTRPRCGNDSVIARRPIRFGFRSLRCHW